MAERPRRLLGGLTILVLALAGTLAAVRGVAAGRHSPEARERTVSHPCGGHERWTVKVLTDLDASQVKFRPRRKTIDQLRTLARPRSIGRGSSRTGPVEFRTYRVRARLDEAKLEEDEDVHLVIHDEHPEHTMIVEFPDPNCPDAAASFKRAAMERARSAFIAKCGLPSRARFTLLWGEATITGVGFWDLKHATPQRGRAPSDIELHPVLSFTRASCERA